MEPIIQDLFLSVDPLFWILPAAAILSAIFALLFPASALRKVGRYKPEESEVSSFPKASVIVYCFDPDDSLMDYLETLCAQDYPDFEVIVVCEATAESIEMLSERVSRRFKNVYVTFIPPGSHNLSRRKLALTLGMKAAKGELVVTTVANASIPSARWLSILLAPLCAHGPVEVSLGYSHTDFSQMHGYGKWFREFSDLLTDSSWIGYALVGKPYRGDGYNLAFRRQIFFDHKGYSQSIYVHTGDDDIFIHEIATPENTRMVLHPDSILSVDWGDSSRRVWRMRKEQYDFTSHWLPRAPFIKAGILSAMQWVVAGCCVAGAILAWPALPIPIASVVVLLLFWLSEIFIYRKAAANMEATRLWWAVPFFWLLKGPLNFLFRMRHRRRRYKNFTWQRK